MKLYALSAILALFLFVQCSSSEKDKQSISSKVFADKVKLIDLDQKKLNLDNYRGKTVILNIWATWCKPCIVEMPSLQQMKGELDSDEFILLLASDESLEKIQKFKDRNKYELNFIQLESSPESLGIYSLPTTFIINQEGELIATETGSKDWSTKASIEEIIHLTK